MPVRGGADPRRGSRAGRPGRGVLPGGGPVAGGAWRGPRRARGSAWRASRRLPATRPSLAGAGPCPMAGPDPARPCRQPVRQPAGRPCRVARRALPLGGGAAPSSGRSGRSSCRAVRHRHSAPARGARRPVCLSAGAAACHRRSGAGVSSLAGPLRRTAHGRAAGTGSSGSSARQPGPVSGQRAHGVVQRRDRERPDPAGAAPRAGRAGDRRHHDRRRAAVRRPLSDDREVRRLRRRVVQRRPVRSARAPEDARLRGRLPVARRVRQAADDLHGDPPFRAGTASGRCGPDAGMPPSCPRKRHARGVTSSRRRRSPVSSRTAGDTSRRSR